MSVDNRTSNQTSALKRKKMFLARVEWLPLTFRSHTRTHKCKISIMIAGTDGSCSCSKLCDFCEFKNIFSAGSESGIILLSTVRSKPRAEISPQDGSSERKNADIGWIRRNLGFVTDPHQICVGLTRCKYGLVIVGKKYSYEDFIPNYYYQNGASYS